MEQDGVGERPHEGAPSWNPGERDDRKAQIIDQIRELGMILARSRMRATQPDAAQPGAAGRAGSEVGVYRAEELGEQAGQAADAGAAAKDSGPFRGQGRLLTLLALVGEVSQQDLSHLLGMGRQAADELLSKMEARGLIERECSPEDCHAVTVRLTDEGMRAAKQLHDAPGMGFDLLGCLSDTELTTLSGYLDRIIRHAEELYPRDDYLGRRRMMRRALEEFRLASRMGSGPAVVPGEGSWAQGAAAGRADDSRADAADGEGRSKEVAR